jgi:hypothetical protein
MGKLTVSFPNNQIPNKVMLAIHETPRKRYSLVPGDSISPGTKLIPIPLGNYGILKIDQIVKNYEIHKKYGRCKEYDFDDSVEKCNLQKVRLKNIEEQLAGHSCSNKRCRFINRTEICAIP